MSRDAQREDILRSLWSITPRHLNGPGFATPERRAMVEAVYRLRKIHPEERAEVTMDFLSHGGLPEDIIVKKVTSGYRSLRNPLLDIPPDGNAWVVRVVPLFQQSPQGWGQEVIFRFEIKRGLASHPDLPLDPRISDLDAHRNLTIRASLEGVEEWERLKARSYAVNALDQIRRIVRLKLWEWTWWPLIKMRVGQALRRHWGYQ